MRSFVLQSLLLSACVCCVVCGVCVCMCVCVVVAVVVVIMMCMDLAVSKSWIGLLGQTFRIHTVWPCSLTSLYLSSSCLMKE